MCLFLLAESLKIEATNFTYDNRIFTSHQPEDFFSQNVLSKVYALISEADANSFVLKSDTWGIPLENEIHLQSWT
jgi:hypothetical protein